MGTEEPTAARARAAEALLHRARGTPESTANLNLSNDPTAEQLIQIILGDPELAALIGAKLHSRDEALMTRIEAFAMLRTRRIEEIVKGCREVRAAPLRCGPCTYCESP